MAEADGDVFTYVQSSIADNSLECTWYGGKLNIAIDNPWAGDTESGFGYTCSVEMPIDKAVELAHWLLKITGEKA